MLFVYLILCFAVAWFGRHRILRFWGNFLLAFFVSPLVVALILIIGAPRRHKEVIERKTVTG